MVNVITTNSTSFSSQVNEAVSTKVAGDSENFAKILNDSVSSAGTIEDSVSSALKTEAVQEELQAVASETVEQINSLEVPDKEKAIIDVLDKSTELIEKNESGDYRAAALYLADAIAPMLNAGVTAEPTANELVTSVESAFGSPLSELSANTNGASVNVSVSSNESENSEQISVAFKTAPPTDTLENDPDELEEISDSGITYIPNGETGEPPLAIIPDDDPLGLYNGNSGNTTSNVAFNNFREEMLSSDSAVTTENIEQNVPTGEQMASMLSRQTPLTSFTSETGESAEVISTENSGNVQNTGNVDGQTITTTAAETTVKPPVVENLEVNLNLEIEGESIAKDIDSIADYLYNKLLGITKEQIGAISESGDYGDSSLIGSFYFNLNVNYKQKEELDSIINPPAEGGDDLILPDGDDTAVTPPALDDGDENIIVPPTNDTENETDNNNNNSSNNNNNTDNSNFIYQNYNYAEKPFEELSDLGKLVRLFNNAEVYPIEQIRDGITDSIGNMWKNTEEFTLTLNPEELGELKISLAFEDGKLFVKIVPETEDMGLLLRNRVESLKEELIAKGVNVENIEIFNPDNTKFQQVEYYSPHYEEPEQNDNRQNRGQENEQNSGEENTDENEYDGVSFSSLLDF